MSDDTRRDAEAFRRLFPAVYLAYHRRDGAQRDLSGSARGVLPHLAQTGPVTIGEASLHLGRAQSVVSDIVAGPERSGLMERENDPADRRRTLVWLTTAGRDRLTREAQVLDPALVAGAMDGVDARTRDALLEAMSALVEARPSPPTRPKEHR